MKTMVQDASKFNDEMSQPIISESTGYIIKPDNDDNNHASDDIVLTFDDNVQTNDEIVLTPAADNHEPLSGIVKLEYCKFLVPELDRRGPEESQREEKGEGSQVSGNREGVCP